MNGPPRRLVWVEENEQRQGKKQIPLRGMEDQKSKCSSNSKGSCGSLRCVRKSADFGRDDKFRMGWRRAKRGERTYG